MPGFDEVLAAAADAGAIARDAVRQGEQVVAALRADPWQDAAGELNDQPLAAAEAASARRSTRPAADSVRRRNSPSRRADAPAPPLAAKRDPALLDMVSRR